MEDLSLPTAPIPQIPLFDPADAVTLLAPEVDAPGYWVGAPSVWVDEREGMFITVRHRRPIGAGRGWKSTVYRTFNGTTLQPVWSCLAEQIGTESIERCALVRPIDGPWRFYLSYVDPADRRWRIDLIEADELEALDISVRDPVLTAASTDSEGVKDPVVLIMDGVTHLFAGYGPRSTVTPGATYEQLHGTGNVFTTGLVRHPTGHWVAEDGRRFEFQRDVLTPTGSGWDANVTRISTIMPTNVGYVLLYDGRTTRGDVYEDRVGLATSADLVYVQKQSFDKPLLEGIHGRGCLRYLDYASVNDDLLYYFETSRPSGAHELAMCRVSMKGE